MMQKTWIIIGGSVLLPNVGGFLGGFITRSQIKGWYEGKWSMFRYLMDQA